VFKLARYLKPYKKEFILGPLFKLLEAIFELLLPTIMALMINDGVNRHDPSFVFRAGGLMAAMAVLGFLSALVCQYFAARASQGFGTELRNDLFSRIQALSVAQLDAFGTQTLTNRLTNDVNTLQLSVAMLIRLVVRAPFICVGAIVMAMILNLRLSLILIASAPVFVAIIWIIMSRSSPLYRAYQKKLDSISVVVRENLSGVRVIRAFAKTADEKRRFDAANDDLTGTALLVGRVSALMNPLTTVAVNAGILAILWVGGSMVADGTLMQGQIIAFVNYVTQTLLALIVVSNLVIIFTRASASGKRVIEILEAVPDMPNRDGEAPRFAADSPAIEFENVSFGYGGGTALRGLSLSIGRGETLGIIGGTGAGKSTLVSLAARFYDPTEGEIRIDGVPVRDIPDGALRAKVGLAPQKAVLFTGTIAENIRFGKPGASDEEVAEAAHIAQASEFIGKLPLGYETPMERGGVNFSGGQKQRINLARALVSKPEILLLDDVSSALDYSTDAAMRRALKAARAGLTTIIVSQRAASIRDADRILVLDNGAVAGIGGHDELVRSCAAYRDIIESQA
jgi:ATP-binding cassette, subfamily B, multidrug efflux pump